MNLLKWSEDSVKNIYFVVLDYKTEIWIGWGHIKMRNKTKTSFEKAYWTQTKISL